MGKNAARCIVSRSGLGLQIQRAAIEHAARCVFEGMFLLSFPLYFADSSSGGIKRNFRCGIFVEKVSSQNICIS